jgi:type II secretory pathway pseudopilin PulG
MEIIAFAILALLLVIAIARLTAGRRRSRRELGRVQAARESRQILKELSVQAGDSGSATQIDVDQHNQIVADHRRPDARKQTRRRRKMISHPDARSGASNHVGPEKSPAAMRRASSLERNAGRRQ